MPKPAIVCQKADVNRYIHRIYLLVLRVVYLLFGVNDLQMFPSAGLLLREIKSFGRAALLLSTLLEVNVGHIENLADSAFALDQRKDLFRKTERIIIDLGFLHNQFFFKLFFF